MKNAKAIDSKKYLDLIKKFKQEESFQIAQNALSQATINEVIVDPAAQEKQPYLFSNDIRMETLSVTDQARSGRCWLFATFNVMRVHVAKKYKIKNFEFSQSYSAFWDKFERANYFLNNVIKTASLPLTDREVDRLMANGFGGDGGFFEFGVSVIKKYGVVPVEIMPDSATAKETRAINVFLDRHLKVAAEKIRKAVNNPDKQNEIKEMALKDALKMLTRCYGPIPGAFSYSYQVQEKKNKLTKTVSFKSPLEFFEKFVQYKFDNYIDIINYNVKNKKFNQMYELEDTKTIIETNNILALNVTKPILKLASLAAILNNEPIWFACQYGTCGNAKTGIFDFKVYDYETLFDIKLNKDQPAMESVGQLVSNHAMIFLGFHYNETASKQKQQNLIKDFAKLSKNPQELFERLADAIVIDRWKVENSHSEKSGNKGFVVITDSWFNQFVSQAVITKKSLQNFFDKYPLVDKKLALLLKKLDGFETTFGKGLKTKPELLSKYEPFAVNANNLSKGCK
ncbi:C1 family peptidase [[Mycoplasma] testudinis]|uniref:C1 family peptidase n=1 Tax=[Mycoplasma] testudinis TaxID=33924 RepID=UPI0004855295|nr:C1 family peptidase [[Mycoplasma] testudinis]